LLCPAARFPNCPAAAPLAERRSNGLLNYTGQFGKLTARPNWAQQSQHCRTYLRTLKDFYDIRLHVGSTFSSMKKTVCLSKDHQHRIFSLRIDTFSKNIFFID
jgi:hypothetical protein